jgi:hypothetical protein
MTKQIQQHITSIYDLLTHHNTSKDFTEIRYWLLHSYLGTNDNFLATIFKVDNQTKLVTKSLNQLSESVDDLEIFINQCKQLILVTKEKDKKFAKHYDKYHAKSKKLAFQ